jgi:hypothetical protein
MNFRPTRVQSLLLCIVLVAASAFSAFLILAELGSDGLFAYPLTFTLFLLWPLLYVSTRFESWLLIRALFLAFSAYVSFFAAFGAVLLTDEYALAGTAGAFVIGAALRLSLCIQAKPLFWPVLLIAGFMGGLFYGLVSGGERTLSTAIANGGWQLLVAIAVIIGSEVMPHNQLKKAPALQAGTH